MFRSRFPAGRRLAPAAMALFAALAAAPAAAPAAAADPAQRALDSLLTVTRKDPGNGLAQLRLGGALAAAGRRAEAERAYRAADRLGFARMIARYNVAALSALEARPDSARRWLELAFAAGYGDFAGLAADADFASLRDDAAFDTLVAGARRRAYPCEGDPRYRAFDFWIGDWDVMAGGVRVGTNRITRELAGCAIRESWRAHPATGGFGHSMNRFDPATGHWRQLWIDSSGNQTDYTGQVFADSLRFEGVVVGPGGPRSRSVMTFTPLPDGTVRQFIRTAPLDRDEWTTGFDAVYVRRSEPLEER